MGCQMPVMDGYAAAAELRRRSLKGSAMAVGATAITRVAAKVERGDFSALPRLSDAVERTCARLVTA